MPKQEIYPPGTNLPTQTKPANITVNIPAIRTGGFVESHMNARRWGAQSKAVRALADLNAAEAECTERQTALVRGTVALRTNLAELQDLPEKLGHELQVRRIQRTEVVLREMHVVARNELVRETERTELRGKLTDSQTELKQSQRRYLTANQEYEAQEKYGDGNAAIAHHNLRHQLLDLQLEEKAKRRILRKLEKGDEVTEEEMLEALYRGDNEE